MRCANAQPESIEKLPKFHMRSLVWVEGYCNRNVDAVVGFFYWSSYARGIAVQISVCLLQ